MSGAERASTVFEEVHGDSRSHGRVHAQSGADGGGGRGRLGAGGNTLHQSECREAGGREGERLHFCLQDGRATATSVRP